MTTIQEVARAKNSVRLASPQALLSLSVPDADPTTGIFKIDKLTADIVVKVPKSGDMRNTDSIRLYWNGNPYGDPVDLSTVDLTDPSIVEFDLFLKPADYPPNGTDTPVVLDYEVYDTDSENGQLSNLPVTVRFDQLAPGGEQLPPLSFTEDQLSGITVGDLVNGFLNIVVEPFFDSWEQDEIELWLGTGSTAGSYLPTKFFVADPRTPHPVTITEDELKTLPPGPVYFGYRVTDWAGNVSGISDLIIVPVFLDLPTLPAPLVPENDDGLITYNDAVDTVGVEIPLFNGAAVGDNIYVVWNGVTLPPYPIPDKDADPLATIAVPYNVVAQFPLVPALPVSYWLQRTGTPRIDSPPTTVNVNLTTPGGPDPDPDPETPAHENIKAPDIQCGTSPLNSISPADYGKTAAATLFRAGEDLSVIWLIDDALQLYWGTPPIAVGSPIIVTAVTESSNIPVLVPFTGVIEGSTGDVPVYFTITRILDGTNTVTVKSPIQTVRVTSSGDLPGDGTLAPGFFPEANPRNIITRAAGIDGTTFQIPLSGVSNIELSKNPRISYNFVGVSSADATDPTAPPIEASRLTATDVPVTQAMLTAGYYEVQLPYSLTYLICRNGAILDYSISNDSGPINAAQQFVRFAMNLGGGTCSLP